MSGSKGARHKSTPVSCSNRCALEERNGVFHPTRFNSSIGPQHAFQMAIFSEALSVLVLP